MAQTPPPDEPPPPPSPESSGTPPPPPPPPMQPPAGPPPPSSSFTPPAGPFPEGTAAKNPILALILSLIIPGLGQLVINGDTTKGVILIVAYVIAWGTCFILIGFVLVPIVIAYAAYDAFMGAKNWNVAHGFPPGV